MPLRPLSATPRTSLVEKARLGADFDAGFGADAGAATGVGGAVGFARAGSGSGSRSAVSEASGSIANAATNASALTTCSQLLALTLRVNLPVFSAGARSVPRLPPPASTISTLQVGAFSAAPTWFRLNCPS